MAVPLAPGEVLRLILRAETPGQMAAATSRFDDAYGRRAWESFDARKGDRLLRELVPREREPELLLHLVKVSRPTFHDDTSFHYRVVLVGLASRACRDYPALRVTLEDMLLRGPDVLQQVAGGILRELGSSAWDSWPAAREALDAGAGPLGQQALQHFVVRCVRDDPSRLAEIDAALWNGPPEGWLRVLAELGDIAAPAASHVALIATDRGESAYVRASALRALEAMGDLPSDGVDAVLACIDDGQEHVRRSAIEAAGRLRLAPERFLPRLLAHVDDHMDDYQDIAEAAMDAIAAYGSAARTFVRGLEARLATLVASDDTSQRNAAHRRALAEAIRAITREPA